MIRFFSAALAASLLVVAPVHAESTTFAVFTPIGTAANLYWRNNGSGESNGSGGLLYTISPGTATQGSAQVSFSFLQPELSPYVQSVTANFTMLGYAVHDPAATASGFKIQQLQYLEFAFTTTSAITIGSTVLAAGSNLLSGSMNNGSIVGQTGAATGFLGASTTETAAFAYTSDFLDFGSTAERDLSLGLTSISSPLQSTAGDALRTFKATGTGSFSSDDAPIPTVPEPETWAMMLVGLCVAGATARRRVPAA